MSLIKLILLLSAPFNRKLWASPPCSVPQMLRRVVHKQKQQALKRGQHFVQLQWLNENNKECNRTKKEGDLVHHKKSTKPWFKEIKIFSTVSLTPKRWLLANTVAGGGTLFSESRAQCWKPEKGLVMAEVAHWCPNYMDRAVAPGHDLMTLIRLVCLLKISLECTQPDRQDHSSLSSI